MQPTKRRGRMVTDKKLRGAKRIRCVPYADCGSFPPKGGAGVRRFPIQESRCTAEVAANRRLADHETIFRSAFTAACGSVADFERGWSQRKRRIDRGTRTAGARATASRIVQVDLEGVSNTPSTGGHDDGHSGLDVDERSDYRRTCGSVVHGGAG